MSQLCPICGDPGTIQAHGRIAPFILQLQGDPKNAPRDTTLCRCDRCDLVYFSHRFDDDTLAAMYSGYRNERYLSNRQPCATHVSLMRDRGFEVTRELRQRIEGIPRERLASRWRDVTDDDLVSATALIQARLKER